LINPLAIATLWACPPEILFARLYIWSSSPTAFSKSLASFSAVSKIPEICLGNNTFSSTERSLSKLENWKMNPNFLFLNEEILLSFNVVVSIPSMKIFPFVGWSNNPIMLSKIYGEGENKVKALDNVSLSIEQGEVVLIVGSSGSGKSTLLNMIGLLDHPTNGKIFIDGIDTTTLNDDKISSFRNKKLGFIFQFSNLLSDLSVLENVLLPRQIEGTNNAAEKDARDLLKAVGLEDQMHKRANKISGGQAQRVAIARGLINKPSIVLADEPTGNLDSVTSETIVQLMNSMAKKLNQTFIIVTHERERFGSVDRVITKHFLILKDH